MGKKDLKTQVNCSFPKPQIKEAAALFKSGVCTVFRKPIQNTFYLTNALHQTHHQHTSEPNLNHRLKNNSTKGLTKHLLRAKVHSTKSLGIQSFTRSPQQKHLIVSLFLEQDLCINIFGKERKYVVLMITTKPTATIIPHH